MSKPNFSPWPWRLKRHRPSPFNYVIHPYATIEDANGNELAVFNMKHSSPKDRRVMAAASKMYKALEDCKKLFMEMGATVYADGLENVLAMVRGEVRE